MGAMIRFLFPLIAYFCVATVITVGAGYGYLLHTGNLDDEKLFRIVSILHGVDLDELEAEQSTDEAEVPPEELSYKQHQKQTRVAVLHLQAKEDDLKKQLDEFHSQFKQINTAYGRYEKYRDEVEDYLNQRKEEALESGLVNVRTQLQNLHPENQAKPLLKQMLVEGRTDVVILLLSGMSSRYRNEILKTFDDDKELSLLRNMHDQMLAGHPERTFIEDQIQKLENLKQQDNK